MRKNSTTTLAGSGLPRTSTALAEVDSNGQVIGSPDREIETVGFAMPSTGVPMAETVRRALMAYLKTSVKTGI